MSNDIPDVLNDAERAFCVDRLGGAWRDVAVVRNGARSTVVRWTTERGVAWFKADHLLPPPEAAVLEELVRRVPGHVARPVALDPVRGWSLTHDAGPAGLDGASTADWCRVARDFGTVQRATLRDVDVWLDLGCADRRGARLRDCLLAFLDRFGPQLGSASASAVDRLRERVRDACDDLAGDGLPPALVHQDVVPENLVAAPTGTVFLDWSDTVVGHPFFGLDRLLDFCWTDRERRDAVVAAYLDAFDDLAPRPRLERSFSRVLSLRVLYEGLRWEREIDAVGAQTEHGARLLADLLAGLSMAAEHAG